MQQDLEDKKHEVIIGNLESKIKEQSVIIEKKDFELQSTEGLLAETEAKISELNSKLIDQSKQFEQEKIVSTIVFPHKKTVTLKRFYNYSL